MDIFKAIRVAIRSEMAAQKMYDKLAADASDPEVKSLFSFLAEYEVMHQQFLEAECKALMASDHYSGGKPSHWLRSLGKELDNIPLEDESPGSTNTKTRLGLSAVSGLAKILRDANDELLQKQIRYDQELNIAADIQKKLLPQEFPQNIDLQIAGANIMASSIGGDYYDFILNERGQLSIVVADSMGKGIPAALLMTTVRAIWRSYSTSAGSRWPDQILDMINRTTYPDLRATEAFVTMFDAVYDPGSTILRYSSAGHNPPLLREALNPKCRKLEIGGPPLGVLPDPEFPVGEIPLSEDDTLVIYTDGVVEATNRNNQPFGIERLCDLIDQNHNSSADDIKNSILAAVNSYTNNQPQADDITIVILRKA